MGELNAILTDGSIRYLDRRLRGAATGILVFYLLNPGLTFGQEDLQFYTGYSAPTLRGALRALGRFGLVAQLGERPVWALTDRIRQLDFSDLIGQAEGEEKKFFSASSSRDPDPGSDQLLLLNYSSAEKKTFSPEEKAAEVAAMLEVAGVFPDLAAELAADPWVTPARVGAWIARLKADPTVRSLAAVLATNLKRHLEAGPGPEAEDRRRYITGQYADFIEH